MKRVACLLFFALFCAAVSAAESESALLAAGKVDAAITQLRTRLKTNPSDAEAQHLLCRAFYSLEQWDAAIDAGLKAVQLQPSNSDYHLWLARAYGEKADDASAFSAPGLARKARDQFEAAVAAEGNNIPARLDLSEYYVEAPGFLGGGNDKASAQADAIAGRDRAAAAWIRGRIAQKNQNWTEAEKQFRAAIAAAKDPGRYWMALASMYRKQGRLDMVQSTIAKAVEGAHGALLFDAAELLLRSGRNFPEAVRLLREYLGGPTVEEAPAFHAHTVLGELLEKQGKKQEAAVAYRAALALASSYEPARRGLQRVSR